MCATPRSSPVYRSRSRRMSFTAGVGRQVRQAGRQVGGQAGRRDGAGGQGDKRASGGPRRGAGAGRAAGERRARWEGEGKRPGHGGRQSARQPRHAAGAAQPGASRQGARPPTAPTHPPATPRHTHTHTTHPPGACGTNRKRSASSSVCGATPPTRRMQEGSSWGAPGSGRAPALRRRWHW